jgi:hypothetical protein
MDDGWIELFMMGELFYDDAARNDCAWKPDIFHFKNNHQKFA